MENTELELILNEMEFRFGKLPHPTHEPRRFAYYVRMYEYYENKSKNDTDNKNID
jgi:hypothetical protein